jgi:hypothetical protein
VELVDTAAQAARAELTIVEAAELVELLAVV